MRYEELKDIAEGFVQISGHSKGKVVRKYRCTSGNRKGRIVAKPSTCTAPKNVKSMISIKKARARTAPLMKFKTSRTKATTAASKRLSKLNVHSRSKIKPRRKTSTKRRRSSKR